MEKTKKTKIECEYSQHFANLSPPLSPNPQEVALYSKWALGNYNLLLGYTKELINQEWVWEAVDLDVSKCSSPKLRKGDWFDLSKGEERYETIIGDGVLNLVGCDLVESLLKVCRRLIVRFFVHKLNGMKYATYFGDELKRQFAVNPPLEIIPTQDGIVMVVWNQGIRHL